MRGLETASMDSRRRNAYMLLLALVTVAVAGRGSFLWKPEISICGLTLGQSLQSADAEMRWRDYRLAENEPGHHSWSRMDSPNVDIYFDDDERVVSLFGGIPEISGDDVREWSLEQIRRKLGPDSTPQDKNDGSWLYYPEYRLMVASDRQGELCFIWGD